MWLVEITGRSIRTRRVKMYCPLAKYPRMQLLDSFRAVPVIWRVTLSICQMTLCLTGSCLPSRGFLRERRMADLQAMIACFEARLRGPA